MEVEKGRETVDAGGERKLRSITPTDVSQFIRLDQCERYLRLRLDERSGGLGFMRDVGIYPQTLPPLLTESGLRFESAGPALRSCSRR